MGIEADGKEAGTSKAEATDDQAKGKRETSTGGALARLLDETQAARISRFAIKPTQGMIAGVVAVVLGGAFIGGAQFLGGKPQPSITVAQVDPNAQLLRKLEDELHTLKASVDAVRATTESGRQDETIRGLKKSVDLLKQDLEVAKTGTANAVAQLSGKIDKLDRSDKDPSPKLAEITQRLDQLKSDAGGRDKLAEITARLDRIERSISSPAPTASIAPAAKPAAVPVPPPAPPSTSAVDAKPPQPKLATIDGWFLRDVYDGVALLEGRNGLREVSPGQTVPGAGEVRSIERRGRSWVVITSRGIIEADSRW